MDKHIKHSLGRAQSFFDQKWTSDGQLFAPIRLKQLVKERFFISKHLNTSYIDTIDITPLERKYLLEFIVEDYQRQKEAREAFEASREASKRK